MFGGTVPRLSSGCVSCGAGGHSRKPYRLQAGRASFITGQSGLRTGLTKVGLPGATLGLQKEDPTIAELLKPLGYATGQFGKNHLGDRNEFLPTVHGFDEFYGNLYRLNAEEEPELPDYPKNPRSARSMALALCWTARPLTEMTRRSIHASARWASR
jgi:arylsulfatase A-like enzyme